MGSIGAVMFHVVGIMVLTIIAITIAGVSRPRRPRSADRRQYLPEGYVHADSGRAETSHRGE